MNPTTKAFIKGYAIGRKGRVNNMENCVSCRGSGLQDGLYGVEDCSACNGQCLVRKRNHKGQFVSVLPPTPEGGSSA